MSIRQELGEEIHEEGRLTKLLSQLDINPKEECHRSKTWLHNLSSWRYVARLDGLSVVFYADKAPCVFMVWINGFIACQGFPSGIRLGLFQQVDDLSVFRRRRPLQINPGLTRIDHLCPISCRAVPCVRQIRTPFLTWRNCGNFQKPSLLLLPISLLFFVCG